MPDLVIVPGGGIAPSGEIQPWVRSRFDRAIDLCEGAPILCLSAGTPHKRLQLDSAGKPLFEAQAGARYLIERGIPPHRILLEFASWDTIGNAFFARVIHTDLMEARRLLVVNSAFHMLRTEFIFRWVFGLLPDRGYRLTFEAVPDTNVPPHALRFRAAHEAKGLERTRMVAQGITTLMDLHRFLFQEHDLYAAGGIELPWQTSPEFESIY